MLTRSSLTLLLFAATPAAAQQVPIKICVLENGALKEVTANYNRTTGDTLFNGRPFGERYGTTNEYAAAASWYINNEPIVINGHVYVKYGLPRVLGVNEISRFNAFSGVPAFVEAGNTAVTPEVVYVPVRHGCEFQPYQLAEASIDLEKNYREGFSHLSRNENEQAARLFQIGARRGHFASTMELASMYVRGRGVRRDTAAAFRLLRPFVEAGDPRAAVALGDAYRFLDRPGQARGYYLGALQKDQASAAQRLGDLNKSSNAGRQTDLEAVRYFRLYAAMADDPMDRHWLSAMYEAARGVERDAVENLAADQRAAEAGNTVAQYLMGRRYEMGWGVQKDMQAALRYYRQARDKYDYPRHALERLGAS